MEKVARPKREMQAVPPPIKPTHANSNERKGPCGGTSACTLVANLLNASGVAPFIAMSNAEIGRGKLWHGAAAGAMTYAGSLSLIPSFGACARSCHVPRFRSVVWTLAWPRSNWICSSSPPGMAAQHGLVRRRAVGHRTSSDKAARALEYVSRIAYTRGVLDFPPPVPPLLRIGAVWGAVTGSAALAWDFYKWKTNGPRISMVVSPNMVVATPGVGVDRTLNVAVDVTNTGTAKTTLQALGLACYPSRWRRWRGKPAATYVVPNTGSFSPPLPHGLDVGDVWKAFMLQDLLLHGIERENYIQVRLWHSAQRKPVTARLVIHPSD